MFNDTLQLAIPKDTTLCQGETFIINPLPIRLILSGRMEAMVIHTLLHKPGYTALQQNGCGRDTADMNIVFEPCPLRIVAAQCIYSQMVMGGMIFSALCMPVICRILL